MVEILCTLTGVVSGIAIFAALMQQGDPSHLESAVEPAAPAEAESLKGLTAQLQLLTHRVAADVSAHTEKVVHINERLLPAQNEPERILSAISELIQANESMQGQLAAAQQRLSKQSAQLEATAWQARTDSLTGLANRRALEETLKNCIDLAGQSPSTLGLMLIDIDHFKSINDSFGHTTGDAVLASFAHSLSTWCNGKFYSARYGGEEFAIILSGGSSGELARLAAEVRFFISAQAIHHEDLRLTVTASSGLTLIQAGDTLKRVYERADEGLYRSKKTGRNRGFWLDSGQWKPLPAINSQKQVTGAVATPEAAKMITRKKVEEIKEHIATPQVNTPHRPEVTPCCTDDSDVLALNPFVDRLESQLKQLCRAGLPATAIMVEAIGMAPETTPDFDRAWSDVLDIIQANLRGIDVLCRLRQNTVCVFMPGCALNASLERAGGMQRLLAERRTNGGANYYPERFAIAAACAQFNEEAGEFLQRLEDALDEAQDASPVELVVSDATSSYFHTT